MQVFLIPVGDTRYVLYSEVADDYHVQDQEPPGFVQRQARRFNRAIDAARRERDEPGIGARHEESWQQRTRARVIRWIAEHIEEQRLLWRLRRQVVVELVYPSDLSEDRAIGEMRALLQRDARRHVTWLAVNAAGFVVSGLFALVPGPNLLAYYLGFRVLSHHLAWLGARRGLTAVTWRGSANHALAALRRALALDPADRDDTVRAAADRLGLPRLTAFLARIVLPPA